MVLSHDSVLSPGMYLIVQTGTIAGFAPPQPTLRSLPQPIPLAAVASSIAAELIQSFYYLRPGALKKAELFNRPEGIYQLNLHFG